MRNSSKFIVSLMFFIPMWLAFSSLSSWDELSMLYKSEIDLNHQIEGGSLRIDYVDSADYSNSSGVDIGVNEEGIFVDPIFIFSFGKPALLFPWGSIQNCSSKDNWVELALKETTTKVIIKDQEELLKTGCSSHKVKT